MGYIFEREGATTERQIDKDRKTKRTDLGVKGGKELEGGV